MFQIGDKLFVLSKAENKVKEDVCVGTSLSDEGYILIDTKDNGSLPVKLVYATKDEAEAASLVIFSIFKEMEALAKKTNAEMDSMRQQAYGVPEHSELTKQEGAKQ